MTGSSTRLGPQAKSMASSSFQGSTFSIDGAANEPLLKPPVHPSIVVNSAYANEQRRTGIDQMNAPTREEFDAKLETIEARMDTRIATLEGKFELMFHRMDRMSQDLSNAKWWLLGAVFTILFGVAGFNATLLSNMVSSYESGKNTATAITQATEQIKSTQDQLKAIEQRLLAPTQAAPRK